ncbi:MAG: cytidylyltransferase domain-containing protein [Flavobacteriales bacterium]
MKIVAVIIARQGSSRLPGKALAEVLGKPVIGHMIERLKASPILSKVMIATSTNKEDDALEVYGKSQGIDVFRGHPEDVLDRLYNATRDIDADAVIEVGGDCPFLGREIIQTGVDHFIREKADFVTNALLPPYTAPNGYDFILLTKSALKKIHEGAILKSERYQPFQFVIRNPADFKTFSFTLDADYTNWRWTLDYKEDLDFVKRVFEELYPKNPLFEFNEIKQLILAKPEIAEINRMHHDPVVDFMAWSTGSYVKEMHEDIIELLSIAKKAEDKKDYAAARTIYRKIEGFVKELVMRTDSKL